MQDLKTKDIVYLPGVGPARSKLLAVRQHRNQRRNDRLGQRRIDAVHTHMVTVIGTPAQCQLAHIARADNNAV